MTVSKKGPVLANHVNTMPVLIPMPIETKDKGFFRGLVIWYWSTRNWEFSSDWDFYCPDIDEIIVIPKGFEFDGASVPKRLRGYLSPVGLLLVPGIVHDFGYRYDYLWIRTNDGGVIKWSERKGRHYWDEIFFKIGNYVNGVFVINFLAWIALSSGGWFAWQSNRKKNPKEITPASKC